MNLGKNKKAVYINSNFDIDLHGIECECGLCNPNGKSYGSAIIEIPTNTTFESEDDFSDFIKSAEPIEVIYAASQSSSEVNAEWWIKENNYSLYKENQDKE